jgi:hypothetical protein
MEQDSRLIALILGIVVVGGGGFYLWRRSTEPPPPPPVAAPRPTPPPPPAAPPAAPDAAAPRIVHPLEPATAPAAGARPLPALAESDPYVKDALTELLGRKPVATFLNLDGFARSFVTTVDNLANERAQAPLWPVKTTPGNFQTAPRGAATFITDENAGRYTAFLRFVDAVDTRKAVGLYRRLYPLFQEAYEELGYPGKYFNDRVVEVIDHLLETPELPEPPAVKRIEVEGTRPSGLYQFADPALEARSAGQKILLRVGPDNAAKLKAKLADARDLIAKRPPR